MMLSLQPPPIGNRKGTVEDLTTAFRHSRFEGGRTCIPGRCGTCVCVCEDEVAVIMGATGLAMSVDADRLSVHVSVSPVRSIFIRDGVCVQSRSTIVH